MCTKGSSHCLGDIYAEVIEFYKSKVEADFEFTGRVRHERLCE
ncbi:hypothetical protein Memar_0195 [Methanoculleus marisnigri JR1]|uniref:Uncharacterized protein n=1 Tax=Methanoculleus marisnigri (strain ATCC 35101 / DSM 1498 / JR1) TaxID=368407 RepID=A3CRX9_METMJ|nr:hypothetical protein Memar_0195 [Methanoculleus marisnigri JR1]